MGQVLATCLGDLDWSGLTPVVGKGSVSSGEEPARGRCLSNKNCKQILKMTVIFFVCVFTSWGLLQTLQNALLGNRLF